MAENNETNGMDLVLSSNSNEQRKTNLIVNYLPPTMTQKDVLSVFSSVGEVESCRLIRDRETAQSLGYGFVNYHSPEDAKKAVDTLNGLNIQSKTIKVSFARPSSKSMKFSNVYVSGLPKQFTREDLDSLFCPYGTIIDSKILTDRTACYNVCSFVSGVPEVHQMSKGIGFVRFSDHAEAENAIQHLNGVTLQGASLPITVKFANSPTGGIKPMNVFRMEQYYSTYFHIEPYNTHALNTSMMSINSLGPWVIFVYNLSPDTEDVLLWKLFGPFGAVQHVKIVKDSVTNKCKGYGFVSMTNYEAATAAIRSLNGYRVEDRVLQVSFKTSKKG